MHLSSYALYPPLNETQIRAVSGAILNGLYLNQPVPQEKYADIVYATQIGIDNIPLQPLIKMAKSEHVDAFFDDGTLRLGTFLDFNKYEHEEIGDVSEGNFLVVGKNQTGTAFAKLRGGFDQYAFCCYAGEPDNDCIARFGYDDAYRIRDPKGFAQAVSKRIGASSVTYASCVYSKHKAVVSEIPSEFEFGVVSNHLLRIAGIAKYFVKPDRYAHQCEFRFLWQMPGDLELPDVIDCPDATQYCERIKRGDGESWID